MKIFSLLSLNLDMDFILNYSNLVHSEPHLNIYILELKKFLTIRIRTKKKKKINLELDQKRGKILFLISINYLRIKPK